MTKAFDADVALAQAVLSKFEGSPDKYGNKPIKYKDKRDHALEVNGVWDAHTDHVLKQFRRDNGLPQPGWFGRNTLLEPALNDHIQHILLTQFSEEDRRSILGEVNGLIGNHMPCKRQAAATGQVVPMSATEKQMMIQTVYAEAKRANRNDEGRQRVAEIIMNRVVSHQADFPNTIAAVITQKDQFGEWRDRISMKHIPDWAKAEIGEMIDGLNDGTITPMLDGAVHFLREQDLESKHNRKFYEQKGGAGVRIGGHVYFGIDVHARAAWQRAGSVSALSGEQAIRSKGIMQDMGNLFNGQQMVWQKVDVSRKNKSA